MSTHYKCNQCDYAIEVGVGSRGRVYEWKDGEQLNPICWPGWCRSCSKVVHVEFVPPLEALEREIVLIQNKAPSEERLFTIGIDDEWEMENMTRYIDWRKGRVAPSLCYECGGSDLLMPDRQFGDLACQACPGTLTCQLTIVAGTHAYDPDVHSTEGVLLRRGRGLIGCWSSWVVPALGGE